MLRLKLMLMLVCCMADMLVLAMLVSAMLVLATALLLLLLPDMESPMLPTL